MVSHSLTHGLTLETYMVRWKQTVWARAHVLACPTLHCISGKSHRALEGAGTQGRA